MIITARDFPTALTGKGAPGAALRAIRDAYHPAMVCMTLGAEGSLALVGDVEIGTPAFRVPVVDTTGAGDVFRGGFISGWLRDGEAAKVEDVLRYANAVAALKVPRSGRPRGEPDAGGGRCIARGGNGLRNRTRNRPSRRITIATGTVTTAHAGPRAFTGPPSDSRPRPRARRAVRQPIPPRPLASARSGSRATSWFRLVPRTAAIRLSPLVDGLWCDAEAEGDGRVGREPLCSPS